ncbi:hypothetical protein B0G71_7952 [Paraburkholderia sp. BL27I4N3]|uniref:DUF4286 family protein n=1 Tax=Paraburkholderia sp. BL27I4N3 TaxID=1938805 RepID=UPI000E3A40D9|nr:DUF4286 family protein [Paraburkholderia sp. BL27I4N3]REE07445.1 hypothetical protein B0G71_7952 [Paraburkholderia sp. BL27I4N3]
MSPKKKEDSQDGQNLFLLLAVIEGEQDETQLSAAEAYVGRPGERWTGGRRKGGNDAPFEPPQIHLCMWDIEAADVPTQPPPRLPGVWFWIGRQIVPGTARSPANAGGLVCNMTDVDSTHDEELNDWYNTEHIVRLGLVPNVLAVRRFESLDGSPRYMAIYHLADVEVAQGPEWQVASMTPWTMRMGRFRSNQQRWSFTLAPKIELDAAENGTNSSLRVK